MQIQVNVNIDAPALAAAIQALANAIGQPGTLPSPAQAQTAATKTVQPPAGWPTQVAQAPASSPVEMGMGVGLEIPFPATTQPMQLVATAPVQSAPVAPVASPAPAQVPIPQAPMQTPQAASQSAPMAHPTSMPQPAPVPTSTPSYTMDHLAVAGTQLVDAGRQPELISLLNRFGVQALTQLPKERYGEFATALRTLGAKI
ncbi:hypothetical protein [Heliophilum fasciatum]|uniref:hypothetical protein n=1 Tax=Heliophilum fasciatum TaxID=35700 RepID=UPI00104BB450|nr:hypothetical protein [Heliophilum fasciatum]MCW2277758.1 hypothetical protein [Heliophilum fasciatum]